MNACALFIYGDEYKYLQALTSPKASASLLFNTLSNNSSSYMPAWVLLNEPKPIRDSENLISIFNEFEEEIHLYNSDVVYVYISGHGYSVKEGDIFIYSNNSKVGDIETGIKITRIKVLPIFQTTNRFFLVDFFMIICVVIAVNIGQ